MKRREEAGARPPGQRDGFTLAELLVVAVMSVIILGGVARIITVQARGFHGEAAAVRSQSTSRTSVQVLGDELREISATGGDLLTAGNTEIRIRSLQKAGLICDASNASSGVLDVWSIGGLFERGDSVLVFLNDDPAVATDDHWVRGLVTGASTGVSAACGDWTRYSLRGSATGTYPKRRLSLTGSALDEAGVGGIVRSYLTVTYRIEELHGSWTLSRAVGDAPPAALVEHLAPPGEGGLAFSYQDTTGAALTAPQAAADPGAVGQILITVTARLAGPHKGGSGDYDDVLSSSIFLRNNEIPQFIGSIGS